MKAFFFGSIDKDDKGVGLSEEKRCVRALSLLTFAINNRATEPVISAAFSFAGCKADAGWILGGCIS